MSYLQALNAGLLTNASGNAPSTFNYTTISTYPIPSLSQVGGIVNKLDSSVYILTGNSTWNQLSENSLVPIQAGVYMLSAAITFTSSNIWTIDNYILFGLCDITPSMTPANGNICGSTINNGICNMCVPYISNGVGESNQFIRFVYNTNMTNMTVTSIAYTLTRIG